MIESVVNSACKAIFDNRFYPNTFVQRDGGLPQWPAGRYQIVSATNAGTVCGTDDETTDDTRVQIDIVAQTYQEMMDKATAVIAAMQNLDPPFVRDNKQVTFDEPTRTHRTILDFIAYPSSEEES
jgi:hypothetical protein